jgi:hypothetical protein
MKRLKLYRLCTNKKWSPTQSRYHILPNDIYPKVPGFWKTWRIMPALRNRFKRLKSPKVFNDKSYGSPRDYSNGDQAFAIQSAASIW